MTTETWDRLSRPPASALKKIGGGRLRGMTDINPTWRLRAMTEEFGVCGVGWRYEIASRWTEQCGQEVLCFVEVNLYVRDGDGWSAAIPGIGGNKLVEQEKAGLHNSDEGYKMALTDALSVAMKSLGVGAEVYMGNWDGSRYRTPDPVNERSRPTSALDADRRKLESAESEMIQRLNKELAGMVDGSVFMSFAEVKKIAGQGMREAWQTYFDRIPTKDELRASNEQWLYDAAMDAVNSEYEKLVGSFS